MIERSAPTDGHAPWARTIVTIAFLLALLGCQSAVRADTAVIAPWTTELSRIQPDEPFAAIYARRGQVLIFIGAHHENATDSLTFRIIEDAFTRFSIDTLLTEGSAYSNGANPRGLLGYVARQREVDGFVEGGETVPAVRGALASGATVWGGEPDDADVRDRVFSMGFGAEDVLGFYVLRLIPQWVRERRIEGPSDPRLVQLIELQLRHERTSLGLDEAVLPDADAWLGWYRRMNRKAIEEFEPREVGPLADGRYTTNRINAAIGSARDAFLLETVANHFNAGENVMVVFGASHLMQLRPALDRMLGAPCYVGRAVTDATGRCRRR